jgi:hypothetical protein
MGELLFDLFSQQAEMFQPFLFSKEIKGEFGREVAVSDALGLETFQALVKDYGLAEALVVPDALPAEAIGLMVGEGHDSGDSEVAGDTDEPERHSPQVLEVNHLWIDFFQIGAEKFLEPGPTIDLPEILHLGQVHFHPRHPHPVVIIRFIDLAGSEVRLEPAAENENLVGSR